MTISKYLRAIACKKLEKAAEPYFEQLYVSTYCRYIGERFKSILSPFFGNKITKITH